MKILGINISHHPSICFYNNGKVHNFYNEDRFILDKKYEPHKDTKIYQSILKHVDNKPDFICYASYGRNYEYFPVTDQDIINSLQKQLDNIPYYFNIKEHHLYHAITAFYFSKFNEAIAIVVDGGGACHTNIPYQEVESIYAIDHKNIIPIYKHHSSYRSNKHFNVPNYQVHKYTNGYLNKYSNECVGGQLFEKYTYAAGFGHTDDAGKLMGLSSYAYCNKKYKLDYDKVNLAKEAQEKSFEDTCKLIDTIKDKTNNVVLSGGYFLNCSNNFKYVKKYPHLNFFVDPIPHDGGTAIGVAIYYDKYR